MKKKTGFIIGILVCSFFLVIAVVACIFLLTRIQSSYTYHLEKAQKYLDQEEYEWALEEFEKANKTEARGKSAYAGMADVYLAMEEYEDAKEIIETGISETSARSLERKMEKMYTEIPEIAELVAKEEAEALEEAQRKAEEEAAFAAAKQALQEQTMKEPATEPTQPVIKEDYYAAATSKSKAEVEEYAGKVKQLFLDHKWSNIAEMIQYPITIDGKTYEQIPDFIKGGFEGSYRNEFMAAMEAEDCMDMYCDSAGIMMANGSVYFTEVYLGGGSTLRIVGISGLTE